MTAMNGVRRFMTAAFVAVISACGKIDSPTQPITPPPPAVTTVSVTISGDTSIVEGNKGQLRVFANRSDNTTAEITGDPKLTLSSMAPDLASVNTAGVVSALKPGSAQISASYQGLGSSIRVYIRPDGTPWDELLPTSLEERAFIREYIVGEGMKTTRWQDTATAANAVTTIKVWGDSHYLPGVVEGAVSLWNDEPELEGKIKLVLVADSAVAQMHLYGNPSLGLVGGHCGSGDVTVEDHRIVRASVTLATSVPGCNSRKIAHAIGHLLGFWGHTPNGLDLMSGEFITFKLSPLTSKSVLWLYTTPYGTKPI